VRFRGFCELGDPFLLLMQQKARGFYKFYIYLELFIFATLGLINP